MPDYPAEELHLLCAMLQLVKEAPSKRSSADLKCARLLGLEEQISGRSGAGRKSCVPHLCGSIRSDVNKFLTEVESQYNLGPMPRLAPDHLIEKMAAHVNKGSPYPKELTVQVFTYVAETLELICQLITPDLATQPSAKTSLTRLRGLCHDCSQVLTKFIKRQSYYPRLTTVIQSGFPMPSQSRLPHSQK